MLSRWDDLTNVFPCLFFKLTICRRTHRHPGACARDLHWRPTLWAALKLPRPQIIRNGTHHRNAGWHISILVTTCSESRTGWQVITGRSYSTFSPPCFWSILERLKFVSYLVCAARSTGKTIRSCGFRGGWTPFLTSALQRKIPWLPAFRLNIRFGRPYHLLGVPDEPSEHAWSINSTPLQRRRLPWSAFSWILVLWKGSKASN